MVPVAERHFSLFFSFFCGSQSESALAVLRGTPSGNFTSGSKLTRRNKCSATHYQRADQHKSKQKTIPLINIKRIFARPHVYPQIAGEIALLQTPQNQNDIPRPLASDSQRAYSRMPCHSRGELCVRIRRCGKRTVICLPNSRAFSCAGDSRCGINIRAESHPRVPRASRELPEWKWPLKATQKGGQRASRNACVEWIFMSRCRYSTQVVRLTESLLSFPVTMAHEVIADIKRSVRTAYVFLMGRRFLLWPCWGTDAMRV